MRDVIRLFVVEDQALVREGLKGLLALSPEVAVVGDASDGVDALAALPAARPDVVLSDVRMPRMDGIMLIRELAQRGTPVPVLLLTTFDDQPAFEEAVRAGARGFLLKDIGLERLLSAVREVHAGGTALRPGLTERVERRLAKPPQAMGFEPADRPDPLSAKELQILRLVATGRSNTQIAELLGNSEGVVKNHCSAIFSKLGVRDRTQAVLRAIELGWI
nr:response regulator transcription factor [uncultured Caldimonas sp.]